MHKVSVIGLGKLGLPMAVALADRGFEVVGIDIDAQKVEQINKAYMMQYEPGLQKLLIKYAGKDFKCYTDYDVAIKNTPISFIIVGTPSNEDGSFSNNALLSAVTSLAKSLKKANKKYHLIIIGSTVMPGTVIDWVIPKIESVSGKRLHDDFGVCYIPETVALGSVIKDFQNPDVVMIGESDYKAGDIAHCVYQRLVKDRTQFKFMSIPSAEIAKVCLNNFLTMKISFSNFMGNICDHIEGADVDEVMDAVACDSRISPKFFRAGMSYGGTCFPRDTGALIKLANDMGINARLIRAVEEINETQTGLLIAKIRKVLDGGTLGILGMSFKPNTPVSTESPSLKVLEAFPDSYTCDKSITLGETDLWTCLMECDVCVLMHRDEAFIKAIEDFRPKKPITVIDPWRVIDITKVANGVTVI